MEADEENEEPQTEAVFFKFKVGKDLTEYFNFVPDGSLTFENSPIGLDIQKGDVLVRYFSNDVRGWTQDQFMSKYWLNVKEKTRVEMLVFRKGYNPKDMDKSFKVSMKFIGKVKVHQITLGCNSNFCPLIEFCVAKI